MGKQLVPTPPWFAGARSCCHVSLRRSEDRCVLYRAHHCPPASIPTIRPAFREPGACHSMLSIRGWFRILPYQRGSISWSRA